MENAKNKPLRDARSAKGFGIVLVSVRFLTGLHTKRSAIKDQNSYNKCNKKGNKFL